jgi:hypothetical protein
MHQPRCCRQGYDLIEWRQVDEVQGPAAPGWVLSMCLPYGPVFVRVSYCPFCGLRLPDDRELVNGSVVGFQKVEVPKNFMFLEPPETR